MIAGRSTRMEVLELLRRRGRSSAETIANDLGVTPNAVRQHLTNLERDGLVVSQPERSGRGRPSLLFALTERADAVFPKRYGQLATMVLQEVQDMGGPDALDEVFARVAARHATAIEKDLQGLDFDDKLRRVVAWIRRAGTLAEESETTQETAWPPPGIFDVGASWERCAASTNRACADRPHASSKSCASWLWTYRASCTSTRLVWWSMRCSARACGALRKAGSPNGSR